MAHYPVLLKEVLQYVGNKHGLRYIDATIGGGGHAKALLKLNAKTKILGLDWDAFSIEQLRAELKKEKLLSRATLVHSNYANLGKVAPEYGFGQVDGIILDLGFSSLQLDDQSRGFSFQNNGPLDMRYDKSQPLTAAQILNQYKEEKLTTIFKQYGEDLYSKKIAHEIVLHRKLSQFHDVDEAVRVITAALPGKARHKANDSVRRIFQAIRIEVNHELQNLERALPEMVKALTPGGRLAVISFHSLEDRIVKNFFLDQANDCVCPNNFPECVCDTIPSLKILTKKPLTATEQEISENPRSRSAKLRVAEKI